MKKYDKKQFASHILKIKKAESKVIVKIETKYRQYYFILFLFLQSFKMLPMFSEILRAISGLFIT